MVFVLLLQNASSSWRIWCQLNTFENSKLHLIQNCIHLDWRIPENRKTNNPTYFVHLVIFKIFLRCRLDLILRSAIGCYLPRYCWKVYLEIGFNFQCFHDYYIFQGFGFNLYPYFAEVQLTVASLILILSWYFLV